MIEVMNIVALAVGFLFGLWCFGRNTISWIFIIFHSSAFSTKTGFYNLYDMADDEVSFEWYRDHNSGVNKYTDYLKLHADARPSAYETFKETYDALVKSLAFRTLPIALAPAILFWTNWYFYLAGVVIILLGLTAQEVVKNGIRPGFYQHIAIYNTLSTYAKSRVRADQE